MSAIRLTALLALAITIALGASTSESLADRHGGDRIGNGDGGGKTRN